MGCGMIVDVNCVIVGGVLVFVEFEIFKKFLELKERFFVIVGEMGGFKKVKFIMMIYDGVLIIIWGEVELFEIVIVVKVREFFFGK